MASIWGSGNNSVEEVLSLHLYMGSRDHIEITILLLSHFIGWWYKSGWSF